MEMWGSRGKPKNAVSCTYHWTNSSKRCGHGNDLASGHLGSFPPLGSDPIDWSLDYHTWALEWDATAMIFTVDNQLIGATNATVVQPWPSTPFHFIFNTAICGAGYCRVKGAVLPTDDTFFYIDYVRAYTRVSGAPTLAAELAARRGPG